MNREKLIKAIEKISKSNGYTFYFDGEERMPHYITSYPVKLHAMQDGLRLPSVARNAAWNKMEGDLVDVFSQLSEEDFVVAVEKLKVQHSSATLTNHFEVATTASADVITFF